MRRLPWWGAGLVAAGVAYALMAAGLLLARSLIEPDYCGLPGLELVVVLGTLLLHPWLGFFAATAVTRPGWRRSVAAFVLGVPVAFGAIAADVWEIGPVIFPSLGVCEDDIQWLPGLVVTGAAAALYAWSSEHARQAGDVHLDDERPG